MADGAVAPGSSGDRSRWLRKFLKLPPAERVPTELESWDPFAPVKRSRSKPWVRTKVYMMDAVGETTYERKLRMLRQLSLTCYACTMCDLGMRYATREGEPCERDPHVFSNMNPVRVMVVGQNPGWDELAAGTPFVGKAGERFSRELSQHGLSRDDFYICNANRCWTPGNVAPTEKQRQRCEPFLAMEINLIKPLLVVALGSAALSVLCPGVRLTGSIGKIVRSERFEVPVFPMYHPSPRNLQDEWRSQEFSRQMELLCGMVKRLAGDKRPGGDKR